MHHFAGIEERYATFTNAAVLLQSIPYDGTSTWGKGADQGFDSFLQAAENMELYDIETNSEVYKRGIHILSNFLTPGTPKEMFDTVYSKTQELLKYNKFLTFFGGEHSISIGIIKAFYEKFEELTVLQIDAHADLRPEYGGTPYNHACAVYDASRHTNLVQVGIRSMDSSEVQYCDKNNCFFMRDIVSSDTWLDEIDARLSQDVYITLDLDAFDPAIMPATGTPEPGGFDWYQMLSLLKMVFMQCNVVGFDIVELAPIPGLNAPEFLAAKLYYKMLSYKFMHHG